MARLFEKNIKELKKELKETKAMVLKYNKQPLTEEDVNHYAKVFGFNSDEYTFEEKRLLAMDRFLYWCVSPEDDD